MYSNILTSLGSLTVRRSAVAERSDPSIAAAAAAAAVLLEPGTKIYQKKPAFVWIKVGMHADFSCFLACLTSHIIRKHVNGHRKRLTLVTMVALQPVVFNEL